MKNFGSLLAYVGCGLVVEMEEVLLLNLKDTKTVKQDTLVSTFLRLDNALPGLLCNQQGSLLMVCLLILDSH